VLWLIRVVVFAALVAGLVVVVRRLLPRVVVRRRALPAQWREVAKRDERVSQALDLRERLARLATRATSLVDDRLVAEVDEVVEPLVALAELRLELESHLAGLDPAAAARDAAALGPERAERLLASYEALVARRQRLAAQASEVVTGLREIYLDVIDGVSGSAGTLEGAAARTRALGESVRLRVEAEREVGELVDAS
jgi:hypothetical protein